jgi:hypothetical protein
LAQTVFPGKRFHMGKDRLLFDRQGRAMAFVVPPGTHLAGILSLGAQADKVLTSPVAVLPKDSVLIFQTDGWQRGLCDKDGEIIVPAKEQAIGLLRPRVGLLGSYGDSAVCRYTVVDFKSKRQQPFVSEANPIFQQRSSFIQNHGKPSLASVSTIPTTEKVTFREIAPDRFLKESIPGNSFESDYWIDGYDYPVSRLEMFNRFLTAYNLIGMSKQKFIELLGNKGQEKENPDGAKEISFMLIPGGCTMDHVHVKVSFRNDKVEGWRFFNRDKHESEVIVSNVLIDSWDRDGWSKEYGRSLPTVKPRTF